MKTPFVARTQTILPICFVVYTMLICFELYFSQMLSYNKPKHTGTLMLFSYTPPFSRNLEAVINRLILKLKYHYLAYLGLPYLNLLSIYLVVHIVCI